VQLIFETERLILKPRSMNDLEMCIKMDMDVEVTKYIPGTWDGSEEHISFLKSKIQKVYEEGLGYWSVFLKDNPSLLIGWIHLLSDENDVNTTEIGWRLYRYAWGNGYATEAARSIISHAFEIVGSERIIAYTHSENDHSIKVTERLGFKFVSDFIYDNNTPSKSFELKKQDCLCLRSLI